MMIRRRQRRNFSH